MKVLLTSTSFQDTPGKHHKLLESLSANVDRLRGPLDENTLLTVIENYDGVICGDDYFTSSVLHEGKKNNLKVISKYGIGLDKINLDVAEKLGIIVTNCPGVNHIAVAEHAFSLVLSFYKNIYEEICFTKNGEWKRLIGHEIANKSIGILGMGRIGKEIIYRSNAFGLKCFAYDVKIDKKFSDNNSVQICNSVEDLVSKVDILSLNMNLNATNHEIINKNIIKYHMKRGQLIVNCARGQLVSESAILFGLENNIIDGYMTDVMAKEPISTNHPFISHPKITITPHIASRTFQSVQRQGIMAVENLKEHLFE